MWLVATLLGSTDIENSHHFRKDSIAIDIKKTMRIFWRTTPSPPKKGEPLGDIDKCLKNAN